MSDSSQQQEPGTSPGETTPQAGTAAMVGPNPLASLPNPVTAQGQQQSRDWEASFKGLNTRYQEDRQKWETERSQLSQTMQQLTDRLTKLESAQPQDKSPAKEPQDKSPEPDAGKKLGAPIMDDAVYERLVEMEAERYRDNVLLEMSQPGQPGEGLNLFLFRENIPVFPPDVDDSGNVNDSAQRKAIETFINKIKGTQAKTQQQTIAGWTPGSSPGAPRPMTTEDKVKRYEVVAEQYASPEFDNLSPAEQNKIQTEYYDLIKEVGSHVPGLTQPWMDATQLATSVQQLMSRMGLVENQLKRG